MFTGGILFIAVSYSAHNVWPSYETFSNPDGAANEIIAFVGGKTFVTFFLVVYGFLAFGSAYSVFREHELGTIESGKLADIIVLDKSLFTIPADLILLARVELTFMDGKRVWCRNGTVEANLSV
jgi:hypothetical protein